MTNIVTETVTENRGRPRIHESNADRQRAYRERVSRAKDKELRKELRKKMRACPMSVEIDEDTLKKIPRVQKTHSGAETERQRAEAEMPQRDLMDEIISAGRKVLALKLHPDRGGSTEDMQRLNAATEWMQRQNKQLNIVTVSVT